MAAAPPLEPRDCGGLKRRAWNRVHPPLPSPRVARRLPSHPPLRSLRQRRARRERRANAATAQRAGAMERARRCWRRRQRAADYRAKGRERAKLMTLGRPATAALGHYTPGGVRSRPRAARFAPRPLLSSACPPQSHAADLALPSCCLPTSDGARRSNPHSPNARHRRSLPARGFLP
jgi:hypothetical protein